MVKYLKEQDVPCFKKLGRTKKFLKVGKFCDKEEILRVQEKIVALIGNKIKRNLEITPGQRELEVISLKAENMCINKRIKKIKITIVRYWWKNNVEVFYRRSIKSF